MIRWWGQEIRTFRNGAAVNRGQKFDDGFNSSRGTASTPHNFGGGITRSGAPVLSLGLRRRGLRSSGRASRGIQVLGDWPCSKRWIDARSRRRALGRLTRDGGSGGEVVDAPPKWKARPVFGGAMLDDGSLASRGAVVVTRVRIRESFATHASRCSGARRAGGRHRGSSGRARSVHVGARRSSCLVSRWPRDGVRR